MASCPTTASNVCGRHLRASTWYVMKWPCTLLRTTRPAISARSWLQSGTPTAHERVALPLLPSGPGGVRRFPLGGAHPSTLPHEAHSTRPALERGFNPARADCGLQGTATSPSSTATPQKWRRGRDLNPRHRGYPCTAFPVPHLRPLGHPSLDLPSERLRRAPRLDGRA